MITKYKENKKAVEDLFTQLEKKRKSKDETTRKIKDKYYNLVSKLEEGEKKEITLIDRDFEGKETKIKETITEYSKVIDQVKRILALKKIAKDPVDLSFEIKAYGDKSIELIDTIKTPYLELRFYIYENGKPKNKYTLGIRGKSFFGYPEGLIELPQGYGLGLNDWGCNVSLTLKDSPTIDTLKEYYLKNKGKFLNDFLTQHTELVKEYETVRKNNNTPEWERLYWENEKEYYENHYSRGTETEEYRVVLKELKNLNR